MQIAKQRWSNVIGHRAGQPLLIFDHLPLFQHHPMDSLSKEERLMLALDAYKSGLFPSQNAAAKAFNVPPSTFKTQVKGTTSRHDTVANSRKLTNTEEDTLSK